MKIENIRKRTAKSVRDLDIYKLAFDAAMEIFEMSKKFPKEEKYSLTDQIRRSSRSICANLAEGWRKRKYIAMFINKLSDASAEAAETQTWLEFALRCKYIDKNTFQRLDDKYEHIFAMLVIMEQKADTFCSQKSDRPTSYVPRPTSHVLRRSRGSYMKRIIAVTLLVLAVTGCGRSAGPNSSPKPGMLSDFENVKVWDISPEYGFSLKLSKEHVTEGAHSLKVIYPTGGLPSINTKKLPGNWGNYEYFAFDVFNPQKETLDFVIRLDDDTKKRVNIPCPLAPGMNNVKIERKEIAKSINASNISRIVLYLNEPRKRVTLYFDNMRLIGKESVSQSVNTEKQRINVAGRKMIKEEVFTKPLNKNPFPKEGMIEVTVARMEDNGKENALVSSGIPFAPGQLTSEKDFMVLARNGLEIPIAVKALARWPGDGSIRSLLVQFPMVSAQESEKFFLKWGIARTAAEHDIVEVNWVLPEAAIVLPPEWMCLTRVIGEQVSFDENPYTLYDQNIETYFPKIRDAKWTGDVGKDYYYDTAHVFYQLYVRLGKKEYFKSARKEACHYRDEMVIQEGPDRGLCKGYEKLRYIYVQGIMDDYLLTGDEKSLKVAGYMAEYLMRHFEPEKAFFPKNAKHFWTEREVASPFLGAISYYELTGKKEYLDYAERLMRNLYRTQNEWPERGGFIHNLYSHDPEEGARPDEYGGSPFMTGLLLEPIIIYHRLTGSNIAEDSICRALDWLINECLTPDGRSFVYLTCEKRKDEGHPDLNLLIAHAFGYGYKINQDNADRYLEVGKKLFAEGVKNAYLKDRKHFNQNYRSSGHFLAYIAETKPTSFKEIPKSEELSESMKVNTEKKAPDIAFWAIDDCVKVKPGDPVQEHTYVWNGATKTVTIYGAKNEYVAFQLIMKAGDRDIVISDIKASDLAGPVKISNTNVELLKELYLNVREPSTAMYGPASLGKGEYPDPLIPIKSPKGGVPFTIENGRNQPVWADIYIPPEAESGIYKGELVITSEGKKEIINVILEVWDFSLPDETHLKNFFYYGPEQIRWAHKLEPKDSFDYRGLEDRYQRMAHQHRVNLCTDVGFYGDWPGFLERVGRYLNGSAFKEGAGKGVGAPLWIIGEAFDTTNKTNFQEACLWYMEHFQKEGWGDKPFLYVIDEPNSKEAYDEVRKIGKWVDEAPYPGNELPFMVTEQVEPQNPGFGSLVGYVDIWCSGRGFPDKMEERRAAGDRIWTYNGGPDGASIIIDTYGLAPRSWAWTAWRNNIECWFLWDATYWVDKHNLKGQGLSQTDLWEDPLTFDERKRVPAVQFPDWGNGDGVFLYPGYELGVDGPISSFRMKAFRRGMQDYEYLCILEKQGKKDFADNATRELDYRNNKDPQKWYETRLKLAYEILKRAQHE